MSLKLNVGVSRKVGLPDYGSVGASCNLELEIELGLDRTRPGWLPRPGPQGLRRRPPGGPRRAGPLAGAGRSRRMTRRHHRPPRLRPANGNGHADLSRPGRSRARKPATENQVRAIRSIASRQHADLDGLLRDFGVERPEDLSLKQASELIDTLKAASQI